jgi:NAD(P) transhydrogenase
VVLAEARSVADGVCTNNGAIPGKTLREAVLHFSGYKFRSIYGLNNHVKEKVTM